MAVQNNDIFIIEALQHNAGQVIAHLSLNKICPIFNGHFPRQPVVPGACMVQLVKDVLAESLGMKLMMQKATNIKFIQMIIPGDNPVLQLTVTYKTLADGSINTNAIITSATVTCFKMQATYIKL
jgi:3-hydroxyacyl-[acyl-carrier-protein] dehydratase